MTPTTPNFDVNHTRPFASGIIAVSLLAVGFLSRISSTMVPFSTEMPRLR